MAVTRKANRSFRRRLTSSAVAIFSTLVLSSCMGAPTGSEGVTYQGRDEVEQPGEFEDGSTMKAIQDRGKLVVGIRLDAPPFAYRDPNTGLVSGFDVEIARLIASGIFGAQIEGKIEFIELDPRDRELALSQNKVDIALGRYNITIPRQQFADFAGPYYVASQTAVVPGDVNQADAIETVGQLSGRSVCVVPGSSNLSAIERLAPGADTSTSLSSVEACGSAVLSGDVDALIAEQVDVAPLLRSNDRTFDSFEVGAASEEPYGIGVSKQETDLRQFINDRLEVIREDDRWTEAFERTIGDDIDVEQPVVQRY
jgi:glutamate transport system substrate-binding protein